MLEAGPDYGSFGTLGWPSDLLDAATIPTSHDWGYRSGDELPGRALAYERARVIGGCSTHNGCTVSWGHRLDYDGWAARGLPGWSADDLLPLFGEASLRMRVRRFRDDEIAPFHRAFIDAGLDMGMPELDDLESLDGVPSVCAEPSNSPEGVRWNAAFAYLDPVRGRPELEVRGGVTVTHVVVEGGRAIGVDLVDGGVADTVWADLVVVAGGTYGSPGAAAPQRHRSRRGAVEPGPGHRRRRPRGGSQPPRPPRLRAVLRAVGRAGTADDGVPGHREAGPRRAGVREGGHLASGRRRVRHAPVPRGGHGWPARDLHGVAHAALARGLDPAERRSFRTPR